MAITQERVMDIIDAGLDYKNAFARLIQVIDEQRERTRDIHRLQRLSDLAVLDKAISDIFSIAGIGLLRNSGSGTILEFEARHFRSAGGRNKRNKIKAEKRRREAGIKPQARRHVNEPIRDPLYQPISKPFISPPPAPAQIMRLDEDESNPENVEGGMFGEAPQALPSDEELRANSKRIVDEALRSAGYKKDE